MSQSRRFPLASLRTVERDIYRFGQRVRDLLEHAEQHDAGEQTAGDLRSLGYEAVSLAGSLTILGAEMARYVETLGPPDDAPPADVP